jgi:hypothetical protein
MQSDIESAQQAVVSPFHVSVEGNIGAGKSTLITHFSSFPDVDAHVVSSYITVQECALNNYPRDPPVESQGTCLGFKRMCLEKTCTLSQYHSEEHLFITLLFTVLCVFI